VSGANNPITTNVAALGDTLGAAVEVKAGGVFEVAKVSQTLNSITGAGIISLDVIPAVPTVPTGITADTNLILSNIANAVVLGNLAFTGNVIGSGSLGFANANTPTALNLKTLTLSGTNTYEGGTYISANGTIRISKASNIGTGVINIDASGALNLTEGTHTLDNVFRIGGASAVIAVNPNARLTLTNTVGYAAATYSIIKTGTGELILAGPGHYPYPALSANNIILVQGGIVRLANDNAIDHARITASTTAGIRTINGLVLPGTPAAAGTPLAASAIVQSGGDFLVEVAADNKATATDYAPAATLGGTFSNIGGYDLYVIPKGEISISSDDVLLTVRATTTGTNFNPDNVTVKDLSGRTLSNFDIDVSADVAKPTSTLRLRATKNFDVPTFDDPTFVSANTGDPIFFKVQVHANTAISGAVGSYGIYGLPNGFASVLNATSTGYEFSIAVPHGADAGVYRFTAFASSVGDATLAGITGESDELSFEIKDGGTPEVDVPYIGWTWNNLAATTSKVSGSVVLQNKHTVTTIPATNRTDLTSISLQIGTADPITIENPVDGVFTFDVAGAFSAGQSYPLTVVSSAPADYSTSTSASASATVPADDDRENPGSGGGGCDAGFGILSLLAAGAFVTLRRKG
ncbi:MAG: hypothetical protein LBT31_08790, partial [Synergistaceae bacterium]|jgi:autotransporter-associated beta strand protein|nr:hypothetical protein [Synergistaceae bacterium]